MVLSSPQKKINGSMWQKREKKRGGGGKEKKRRRIEEDGSRMDVREIL